MNKLLIGLCVVIPFLSFAFDASISKKLVGKYELIKQSGKGAQYSCDKTLEITVNESGVFTSAFNADFYSINSGCKNSEGDIGPLRTRCTHFSENKVSYSDTQPLTIVGFAREFRSISLDYGTDNQLTYKHNTTEVPFGILGLSDEQDFSCKYQRIESK